MATLPKFHAAPAATVTEAIKLTPAGRCAYVVTLNGRTLGRVRMVPSKDGAPAAWSHGHSFATFGTPEAAAGNLYATKHRRELGRVRKL